jgi:hypothetical protein
MSLATKTMSKGYLIEESLYKFQKWSLPPIKPLISRLPTQSPTAQLLAVFLILFIFPPKNWWSGLCKHRVRSPVDPLGSADDLYEVMWHILLLQLFDGTTHHCNRNASQVYCFQPLLDGKFHHPLAASTTPSFFRGIAREPLNLSSTNSRMGSNFRHVWTTLLCTYPWW